MMENIENNIPTDNSHKEGWLSMPLVFGTALDLDFTSEIENNPPGPFSFSLGRPIEDNAILMTCGVTSESAELDSSTLDYADSNRQDKGLLIDGLADLPERTILDEKRLAAFLGVTTRTVRRMVSRHELPPPVSLTGRSTWIVGRVLAHIERAAERSAKNAEQEQARIERYSS